jgi:hypothetical protein
MAAGFSFLIHALTKLFFHEEFISVLATGTKHKNWGMGYHGEDYAS